MALWEFRCEKCGEMVEMLTSELSHDEQNVKVGESVRGASWKCRCGGGDFVRAASGMARTPDRWK